MFKVLPLNQRHTSCLRCNYMGCPGDVVGHFKFMLWLNKLQFTKRVKKYIRSFSDLDYSKIEDVEIDGIDGRDAPDFCDAFIVSATYKGREMTEKELERLNEDSDYVYSAVEDYLY